MIQGLLGLVVFLLLAWLIGENRRQVSIKTVAIGVVTQLIIGLILLKVPVFRQLFMVLNNGVMALDAATTAGTSFVFGYLGGADLPFAESYPGAAFILAFRALPLVLLISALSALLFYLRILPLVVTGFSWCLQKTMGLGGAEDVPAAIHEGGSFRQNPLPRL